MKFFKLLALLFVFFSSLTTIAFCQENSCYKVNKVDDKTWRIVENNTVNIYLIEGKDSAMVLDGGYGAGDLNAFVKGLTKLPIILVNTHGHWDHTGSDYQFSKVYAHPDDFYMIKQGFAKDRIKKSIQSITKGQNYSDEKLDSLAEITPELVPVKEGYVFDLGNRKLEVIEVPGHTHGSICLLDKENKMLFAGDHINAIVWLFLKDCYPLEVYLRSLEKIKNRIKDYDIIMPGHNTPLDKTFIKEQTTCVKSILNGTCKSVSYNYSELTKGSKLCKYGRAEVAYDPDKLFEK